MGRRYKFEELDYGECNIDKKMSQTLDAEPGDIVYFSFKMQVMMNTLILRYNRYAQ